MEPHPGGWVSDSPSAKLKGGWMGRPQGGREHVVAATCDFVGLALIYPSLREVGRELYISTRKRKKERCIN